MDSRMKEKVQMAGNRIVKRVRSQLPGQHTAVRRSCSEIYFEGGKYFYEKYQ